MMSFNESAFMQAVPAILLVLVSLFLFRKKILSSYILLPLALFVSGLSTYYLSHRGFAFILAGGVILLVATLLFIIFFYIGERKGNPQEARGKLYPGLLVVSILLFMGYLFPAHVGPKLKLPLAILLFALLWFCLKSYKFYVSHQQADLKYILIGANFTLIGILLFMFGTWVQEPMTTVIKFSWLLSYYLGLSLISFGVWLFHNYERNRESPRVG